MPNEVEPEAVVPDLIDEGCDKALPGGSVTQPVQFPLVIAVAAVVAGWPRSGFRC